MFHGTNKTLANIECILKETYMDAVVIVLVICIFSIRYIIV